MKTILIVDDEKKIRTVYGKMLGRQGYNILKAPSIEKAHEMLMSNCIDLVLLDIDMEETAGTLLFKVINEFFPATHVIVIGPSSPEVQKKQINGALDYYDKSQCVSVLTDKVFAALFPQHSDIVPQVFKKVHVK